MADVQRMNGSFEPPQLCGETAVLTGTAPVACMRGYAREVAGYTQGLCKLWGCLLPASPLRRR